MSTSADNRPGEDGVRPAFPVRLFSAVSATLCAVGTLGIIAIMLIINIDVFGRALFNQPMRGVPEMVSLMIVAIVFLQLTHTLRQRRFIHSDVIINRVLSSKPRLGLFIQAVQSLVGVAMLLTIFIFTISRFNRAIEIDEYIGTEGDFTAPLWPVFLIILIGSAGTALQYFLHMVETLRSIKGAPRS